MCGIVAYVGPRDIPSVILVGLERLSYRGYDSAGISVLSKNEISTWKRAGKLFNLSNVFKSLTIQANLGIGHTRWATHGEPNEINAHPHLCPNKKIAIVHNGIIENHLQLKKMLQAEGHIFRSETDSEVIAHLIDKHFDTDLETAVQRACQDLEGTYGLAAISEKEPDKIVACRKGSPLIIGLGKNENFLASDINAVINHTKDIIFLEDDECAIISKDSYKVTDIHGNPIDKEVKTMTWSPEDAEKGGYDHFMLKEINEQPSVVRQILSKHIQNKQIEFKHLNMPKDCVDTIGRFIIQACGTSWHAGLIAKYWLEKFARIPTEVDISSEFRYRHLLSSGNEAVIAISQSGETADTLACIREAKSKFFKVFSFVNVKNSSIDRESDGVIYTHSGPEIGVASTKNYIAQLVNIYLFALYLGQKKGVLSPEQIQERLDGLSQLPEMIEKTLQLEPQIKELAKKYYQSRDFIFIGRGVNYPTALEGALKLKEISYIHATGYPAGELKHGPIALIDEKMPIVCLCPKSDTYEKMISNIQEVKARKGRLIVIATEGDEEAASLGDDVLFIPESRQDLTAMISVIPLQLLSYHISLLLDCNVDQPRNLAKSVTVE